MAFFCALGTNQPISFFSSGSLFTATSSFVNTTFSGTSWAKKSCRLVPSDSRISTRVAMEGEVNSRSTWEMKPLVNSARSANSSWVRLFCIRRSLIFSPIFTTRPPFRGFVTLNLRFRNTKQVYFNGWRQACQYFQARNLSPIFALPPQTAVFPRKSRSYIFHAAAISCDQEGRSMRELGRIVYLGLMAGVLGTGTGGLLLSYLKRPRDDFLGFLLAFSGGIMLAVVFQDLILEALSLGGVLITLAGII